MSSRVEIEGGWEGEVDSATQELLSGRLGPDIADDARRYCPKRTGALAASIEHHMDDSTLIISASGGGEHEDGNLYVSLRPGTTGRTPTREVHHVDEGGRTYAAYVELGHRVYHPSTGITGPEVVAPRPFLRPALYQERGD
jgi:hypothetical protein